MKRYMTLLYLVLLISIQARAQSVEMATQLRADGKIYAVIAVMLVIFLGVAAYLFSLDRRLGKLEKNSK